MEHVQDRDGNLEGHKISEDMNTAVIYEETKSSSPSDVRLQTAILPCLELQTESKVRIDL